MIKQDSYLKVKNRIYAAVFNLQWVEQQLRLLRPYSQALDAWVASDRQDASRLLRGQALRDAQEWAQGKWLSGRDYQFLAASVESDRRQVQQALEADRLQAIEAQLAQEQHNARLQRRFSIVVSAALVGALGLGMATFWQYRQARSSEQEAKISEIKALVSSANGNFDSHHQLEAITDAIQAKQRLQTLSQVDAALEAQVQGVLQRTIYGIQESNRLSVGAAVKDVVLSPDGKLIASASVDGKVKLWQQNGNLVRELSSDRKHPAHAAPANAVSFSPDGQQLVSAAADRTIKLWNTDGTLLKTLEGHQSEVVEAKFSPDGQMIASTAEDQTVKLWRSDGALLTTLPTKGITVTFSPDSQLIATAAIGQPIHLWRRDGSLIRIFPRVYGSAHKLAFSPNGTKLVNVGMHSITLWDQEGRELQTLTLPHAGIWAVTFSPDGQFIAIAGQDAQIRLLLAQAYNSTIFRSPNEPGVGGEMLVETLLGHRGRVTGVAFNPKGDFLTSASEDGTIRFWKIQHPLFDSFHAEMGGVMQVAISPNQNTIASVGLRGLLNLWHRDSSERFSTRPSRSFLAHQLPINDTTFSPDGQLLVTASRDGTVIAWKLDGTHLQTLTVNSRVAKGDRSSVNSVAFSPNGEWLATASSNHLIKLWQRDRTGLFHPTPARTLADHHAPVEAVAFSSDGRYIVSGGLDNSLKIWDINGKLVRTIAAHQAPIQSVAFSPNADLLVSASEDNTLKLWRTNGSLITTLNGHQAAVLNVQFSVDGRYFASSSIDGTVKIWHSNGSLVKTLKRHDSAVRSTVFILNDNKLLSVGDDQALLLWDLNKILPLNELNYACNWARDYLQITSKVEGHNRLCRDNLQLK